MSSCEIDNVNVIPDARSVSCRVVVAKDLHEFSLAGGGLQDKRNEVRFGLM